MFFFVDRVLLATSQENKGRCWRCCRVSLRKIIGITGGYRVPSIRRWENQRKFSPSWIPFEFDHNMNDCRRSLEMASFNFYWKKVFKHTLLTFFLIQLFLRIVGSEKYETVKSHAWKGLWVAPRVLRGSGPGRLPCFFMEPTTAAAQSSLTPGY